MNAQDTLKTYKIVSVALCGILICVIGIFLIYATAENSGEKAVDRSNFIVIPAVSVLSAFLATCIVMLLYDAFLKRHTDTNMSMLIRHSLEEVWAEKTRLSSYGIVGVHERFHNSIFAEYAGSAKNLFILQTYAPNIPDLRDAILDAMQRGADIRVALISPDSQFVDVRFPEIHSTRDEFVAGIKSTIERLKRYRDGSNGKGKLEVRLYHGAPGVSLYGTENVFIVGNYLSEMDAISSPQLEIRAESRLYQKYLEHFNRIWQKAKEA